MDLEIPVAVGEPSQTFTITLDGRRFIFSIEWNDRLKRWFFKLQTESGQKIISGKHLATKADLLGQIRVYDYSPPGFLTVIDRQGNEDPTLYSLGERHALLYVTALQ